MRLKKIALSMLASALIICNTIPAFAAGWTSTKDGWKYDWGSGSYCENGWVQYKNHWFYFGSDQLLRTGWFQKDNTWYFASDSGALQAGLIKVNGNVYYMDSNSLKLFTGSRNVDGNNFTFGEYGTTDGTPYVYSEWNSNGSLKRGTEHKVR